MCENFLNQKDLVLLQEEILIFAYFAGHGCSDHSQYYLLNESKVDKIFWPAETKLRQLGSLGGTCTKVVAVYDICREPYEPLKTKIQKAI